MASFVRQRIRRLTKLTRGVGFFPANHSLLVSLCMNGRISGSELATVRSTTVLHILRFLCCARRPIRFRSNISNTGWALRNISYYPTVTMSALPADWFPWEISVSDDPVAPRQGTKCHLEILYDYSPRLDLGSNDMVMPYGIHPVHLHTTGLDGLTSQLPVLRRTNRSQKMLFAGTVNPFYSKNAYLQSMFGKLDRCEILSHLRSTGVFDESRPPGDEPWKTDEGRFLLIDSATGGIPASEWFSTLSRFDFLLCPPGVIMPMCHNIIEAMAVGTIPVTNYPEWFFPPLRHGEECLVFSGKDDLMARIEEIRTLSPARIAAMRQACITYYDAHLDPRAVFNRILQSGLDHVRLHVLDETLGSLGIASPT